MTRNEWEEEVMVWVAINLGIMQSDAEGLCETYKTLIDKCWDAGTDSKTTANKIVQLTNHHAS